MASSDDEYFDVGDSDDEYFDVGDSDDDVSYQDTEDESGRSDDDDGHFTYDDEEGEEHVEEAEDEEEEKLYGILTEDAVRALQDECTAGVADLISVPPGLAVAVLQHCRWSASAVEERWFDPDEQRRIRDAVGLPPPGGGVGPVATNAAPLTCAICFDVHPPGKMRSAGCAAHFYCVECWRGYLRAAVGDGPRCLSLRCPEPSCSAAVVRDLVDEVANDGDRERYARFAVRSYVEESDKKKRTMRWCPAPECTIAVEFLGGGRCRERLDVVCACKNVFCLNCGDEAHRPVSCDKVAEWLAKHGSEAETANWVLSHTKHCPECHRPIEKNQGCMHMTCSAPCNHQFCWLCLGAWSEHRGGYYSCNRYAAAKREGRFTEEETRRQQAKASVERYLHFYEAHGRSRQKAHGRSRQKALEDMAELEQSPEILAAAFGVVATKVDFVTKAYAQVAECRRLLRWTYAYGYYMPDDAPAKRELYECLQSDAEASLERLHGCAEKERREIIGGEDPAGMFEAYQTKLAGLTAVTRNYFENLLKALENDLAEVNG